MTTQQIDDLANANNGIGSTVDVASLLGNGVAVIPKAVAVAESSVTAGAVQLQTGVNSATGITWTAVAAGQAVNPGAGLNVTAPGAPAAFVRAVVTTPIVGGKVTVVITA